jgi:hypothetical protein
VRVKGAKLLLVAAAVSWAALAGGLDGKAAPDSVQAKGSPQAEVRAALLHQVQLFKQQRWRSLYATTSPGLRARCPYRSYVRAQRAVRAVLGSNFRLRGIRVRLANPRRAIASYRLMRNGRTVAQTTADRFVRVGGRWLDEFDRGSC